MRPYVEYDKNHPGFESLPPQDQKKLAQFNKQQDAGVELAAPDQEEFQKIKDNMNNPIPIDENHPGWNNLIPKEKRRFKNLQAKEEE